MKKSQLLLVVIGMGAAAACGSDLEVAVDTGGDPFAAVSSAGVDTGGLSVLMAEAAFGSEAVVASSGGGTLTEQKSCQSIGGKAYANASAQYRYHDQGKHGSITYYIDESANAGVRAIFSRAEDTISCKGEEPDLPLEDMAGVEMQAHASHGGRNQYIVTNSGDAFDSVYLNVSWSGSGRNDVDFTSSEPLPDEKVRIEGEGLPVGRVSINVTAQVDFQPYRDSFEMELSTPASRPIVGYGIGNLDGVVEPFWDKTVIETGGFEGTISSRDLSIQGDYKDVEFEYGIRCRVYAGTITGTLENKAGDTETFLVTFGQEGHTIQFGDGDLQPYVPLGCPAS